MVNKNQKPKTKPENAIVIVSAETRPAGLSLPRLCNGDLCGETSYALYLGIRPKRGGGAK